MQMGSDTRVISTRTASRAMGPITTKMGIIIRVSGRRISAGVKVGSVIGMGGGFRDGGRRMRKMGRGLDGMRVAGSLGRCGLGVSCEVRRRLGGGSD